MSSRLRRLEVSRLLPAPAGEYRWEVAVVTASCVRVGALVLERHSFWESSREQAHFPAEQPASQPYPRLPASHAYARRSFHHFSPSPAGPRPSGRLTPPVLPVESRLRTPEDFRGTLRQGVKAGRPSLVLHARRRDVPPSRAGFVVSRAVGGAVVRNRVKRRLRHLAAAELRGVDFPVDLVVRALPEAATGDLAGDFHASMARCTARLAA